MQLRFAWPPGLSLAVRYRRVVREDGPRAGRATFGRRFTWRVEPLEADLRIRPSDIVVVDPSDTRPPQSYRRFYDALVDAPPDLRVTTDGTFVDVVEPEATVRAAGIDTAALRELPPDARRVIAGLADRRSLAAIAADQWNTIAQEWATLADAPTEPVVVQHRGQLPVVGAAARFLLTMSAAAEADGSVVLELRSEPAPEDVAAALRRRGGPITDLHVTSTVTLHTDPATLVPRALETRRVQEVLVADHPPGRQIDTRTWAFKRLA